MKSALIVIDFINEIVDPKGKLAGKGYATFIEQASTFKHLNNAIHAFRQKKSPVIFVRLGYDHQYSDQPKLSPVFGKADEFGILKTGEWSTQFHPSIDYKNTDVTIQKTRVSAFYGTSLLNTLQEMCITNLYIAGVATDLAVESAARDAHDRDFLVSVIADACAAATIEDHEKSLRFLPKIGTVLTSTEINL